MSSNVYKYSSFLLLCAVLSVGEAADGGVGYLQEWATGAGTGDTVVVDVFLPLDGDAALALPPAEFSYFVPVPNVPGGLIDISTQLGFHVTGVHLAFATGSTVVRAVSDAGTYIGRHGRAVVLLPGAAAPAFPFHVTATRLAEAGYVVFAATLPSISPTDENPLCKLQQLTDAVLDFIENHEVYGNLDEIFGVGHSIGGYTLIAMMSEAQHCPELERDERLRAAALLDATWEATTPAQLEGFEADAISFCQACVYRQMALQVESGITRIDLEGFVANPFSGEALPFGEENLLNHITLFTQNCLMEEVIRNAGGPPLSPFQALCQFAETMQIELRSVDAIIEQTEAYFNHVSMGRPRVWPSGGQPDEAYVHLIDEIPPQPIDGYSAYCFAPGALVVSFGVDDFPGRQ